MTVLPLPLALASVSAPVRPFNELTFDPVEQVAQVILPLASIASGPLALTTRVPDAFGMVMVLLLLAGVAKVSVFVTPEAVLVRFTFAPCRVRSCALAPTVNAAVGVNVLTDRVPPIVTVVPLSVMIESPMAWPPVNLATLLVVPPLVVTPPPTPAQLPVVVQTSYVPAAAVRNRYVTLAVGAWKASVVVFAPLVAVMVLAELPWTRKL